MNGAPTTGAISRGLKPEIGEGFDVQAKAWTYPRGKDNDGT